MSTFNNYLPFTVLKLLHSNLTYLRTNAESKYEIMDVKKLPYIAKFNKGIENFLSVGDEDGWIKFFKTHKKLTHVKEFQAGKNCIYDIEWLNSNQLACGGGDQQVFVFDVSTSQRVSILSGHKESVKAIAGVPENEHVLASGARDGSLLVFDLRCNRSATTNTDSSDETATTSVRAMHSLARAHFMDTASSTSSRSVLKSKTSNFSSPHHHHHHHQYHNHIVKPSPIACLAFQNEFTLVSAGATDGFIKIWDIRKLWSSSSSSSSSPPQPVHTIEQGEPIATKRGFSSLVFNSARSHIYTNGMNSQICEHNMMTLMREHTRPINTRSVTGAGQTNTLNSNNTAFIKSSLSPCGQFLLTGSSDSNAYIFSTSLNRNSSVFERSMPVIVLRAHDSEVTTVDWNPFDIGQCVTCSDDNTIRLWSVQREIDEIEMGEFNFFKADVVLEDDEDELDTTTATTNLSLDDSLTSAFNRTSTSTTSHVNLNTYMSMMRNNGRKYGVRDNISSTSIYDDLLFRAYECCGPLGRYSRPNRIMDLAEIDLVERCESITLEAAMNEKSPKAVMSKTVDTNESTFIQFTPTKSLLTHLPINILENDEPNQPPIAVSKKLPPDNILLSFLKTQTNSIPVKKVRQLRKQVNKSEEQNYPTTPSTTTMSKKRAQVDDIVDSKTDSSAVHRSSKRRLIQNDEEKPTNQQPHTPKSSSARTILHYFTPKSAVLP